MTLEHEEKIIELKKYDNKNSQEMREIAAHDAAEFKKTWIKLGQALVSIHRDKLFEYWGYEKFEIYCEKELCIKKSVAIGIIKTYLFTEDWHPEMINEEFLATATPEQLPNFDAMSLLRKTRSNKHLTKEDYDQISKKVLEKKIPLAEVRKDVTALIKQRKEADSNEVRDERQAKSVKKFVAHAKSFAVEAGTLKMLPADLLKRVNDVIADVEGFLDA